MEWTEFNTVAECDKTSFRELAVPVTSQSIGQPHPSAQATGSEDCSAEAGKGKDQILRATRGTNQPRKRTNAAQSLL